MAHYQRIPGGGDPGGRRWSTRGLVSSLGVGVGSKTILTSGAARHALSNPILTLHSALGIADTLLDWVRGGFAATPILLIKISLPPTLPTSSLAVARHGGCVHARSLPTPLTWDYSAHAVLSMPKRIMHVVEGCVEHPEFVLWPFIIREGLRFIITPTKTPPSYAENQFGCSGDGS